MAEKAKVEKLLVLFAAAHDELPGGDHEGFGEGLAAQQAHLAALLLA